MNFANFGFCFHVANELQMHEAIHCVMYVSRCVRVYQARRQGDARGQVQPPFSLKGGAATNLRPFPPPHPALSP